MSRRRVGQQGFSDHLVKQRAGINQGLEQIRAVVDWDEVERCLTAVEPSALGAPGYPALVMLRCLFVGELYGLSDPALEEALSDRLSFRRFVGLSLEDDVPDHSTLWRFRESLRRSGVHDAVFEEVNRQFEARGLITRKGTILDATIIEARASRPAKDRPSAKQRVDHDAAFTKKAGRSYYGYKGHVGMDEESSLIRTRVFTPANVNDTVPADALIVGDEAAVYADPAYDTHARRTDLKRRGIKPRLMYRPNRHHPDLPPWKARFNKLVSKRRSPVERIFADMKQWRGWTRVRGWTLARNATRFTLLCTAINLKRAAAHAL